MPKFLLPRLSPNAPLTPIQSGVWEEADINGNFLQGLADGLAVAANNNVSRDIDSIPDIWARPLFFQMALYAGLSPQNNTFDIGVCERALGEWRALLAILALQSKRHLRLTAEEIHLNQQNNQQNPNLPNGQLEHMLRALAPRDSVDSMPNNGQGAWSNIYIISYNSNGSDTPLAITSPTTLLVPVADYSSTLSNILTQPWSNDGKFFTDPIENLAPDELSGLYLWLKELENNLLNEIPLYIQQNNETCNRLFKALNNYMQDIQRKANGNLVTPGTLISAGLNLHIGIFRFLDKKIQPPSVATATSSAAVLLKTSKARKEAKPLLLVSPQMLQDISTSRGVPLAQLVVWPGLTAVNINEKSLVDNNRNMIDGVSIGNAQWCRPEEFFTERLVIHEGGNAFTGVLKVRGSEIMAQEDMSVILPLRQEILNYFTPQEIIQNFYIEKVGDAINVQFTFPLSGIDGREIDYKVERSYPMQEVIYLVNNVPVIEIWPNFKRAGWEKYYLYYENSEAQNQVEQAGRDFFYVYPWMYGKNIAGNTPNQGLSNLYTSQLSGFPEALICTVNMTDSSGVHSQIIEAGFVLLAEPNPAPALMGNTWQIGIDFGTSSTMIYYRSGTNDPQPLALQPNLFQVTDSGLMRNRTYRNFIPSSTADQQAGSFLSIFQLLNNNIQGGNIRPLQDGNVFWLLSADGPDANDFRSNSGRIDANLKWKGTPWDLQKVEAYIKQICLQSLAEAAQNGVSNVSWNFSYPTAFSANQQMTFNATCDVAVNDALLNSGFDLGDVDHWPESKAAAYYFSELGGVHFAGGALCLDIGAGTTDVSIISGHPPKIVYHTSLQFAGRYLFRSLYKHYETFAKTKLDFGNMGTEQKNALIDADMRKHSREYLNELRKMTVKEDVQKMLQIAQYATAGIFYYLGGLLGLLHEKGIYVGDDVPEIYVGGNGSRIFSWICGGKFYDGNPYLTVFKDMLVATSGLSLGYGFRLVLSKTPKVEVASGMLENKPHHHATFFDARSIATALFGQAGNDLLIAKSVYAGDVFNLNGKAQKKTEFISAYEISEGINIRSVQELLSFTEKFNTNSHDVWGNNQLIKISDEQIARVSKAVLGEYSKQAGRLPTQIFVEPVFILELKKFMEML